MKKGTLLLSLVIAIIVSVTFNRGFLQNIEYMMSDNLYQRPDTIPDNIKIIAIDDETLNILGPYSDWDRSYFARLIEILNSDKENAPKIIGLDINFTGTNGGPEDAYLAEVAGRYDNIIVASTITFDNYVVKENDKYVNLNYVSREEKPYEKLAAVTPYAFTNITTDDDGFVRSAYSTISSEYNGETKLYNSFAYTIASRVDSTIKQYPPQVEISYTGIPGEFESISMAKVLNNEIDADYFKDCIVLVGAYADAMMDSHRVPIDYSNQMYGVEIQANYIYAFLTERTINTIHSILQFTINLIIILAFSIFAFNAKMRDSVIGLFVVIITYLLIAIGIYHFTSFKIHLLPIPVGTTLALWVAMIYRYFRMQRRRISEMRETLFSMAEAMSVAIEERTPYNANHTKNVARRSLELVDFINHKHRHKKTGLHFSENDKRQLYLAAMLHDVGKMDIPLEIMDKPTKLGERENILRARLESIMLHIDNDALRGIISREDADNEIAQINNFLEQLELYNCGKPLNSDELSTIDTMYNSVYTTPNGVTIPYLTTEEQDDLKIKAGTLSDNERTIMQNHVVYTDKILSQMKFGNQFKDVHRIASGHHELLNGKGYPKGIKDEDICPMTRILTIMDIYDSLIADDRPYKKPKSNKVAFEILEEEAMAGKIDKEILQFTKELYLK